MVEQVLDISEFSVNFFLQLFCSELLMNHKRKFPLGARKGHHSLNSKSYIRRLNIDQKNAILYEIKYSEDRIKLEKKERKK